MAELPLAEVRDLLSRLVELEDEMAAERIPIMLRDDPAWLQLPPAKREAALTRLKVLRAFDANHTPTKAEALAAAVELKVQLRTFYAMLRDWRDKGRTAFALVPYGADGGSARASRLDPAVATRLTEDVRALLADNPSIRPGEAVRAVQSAWPEGLKPPSSVTVRNYLERLKAEQPARPGSLRLNLGTSPQEKGVTATHFGEVIVVDHTSPARLLLDGDTAAPPTITLAIDLWSGVPIGAAVNGGVPRPDGVLDALADAQARVAGFGRDPVRPRILYASTPEAGWEILRESLLADGMGLVERRDHRLHCGGPIKRLIGAKLDDVQLQALRTRRPGVDRLDPNENALLNIREMRFVVDAALDRLVGRRLNPAVERDGGGLSLPERLTARGSLKARCVPLIDLRRDSRDVEGNEVDAIDSAAPAPRDGQPVENELRAVVDGAAGILVSQVDVRAPDELSPGWAVSVLVNDPREVPALWLRLAREAVRLSDMRGITVRFEADAHIRGSDSQART